MRETTLKKRCAAAVLAFLAAALLIGCATMSEPGLTSERMAAAGVDEAAMRRGRALAVTTCAECHRFYWPHEYSAEEWPGIARKMGNRASLSKSQVDDLVLYLVTTSRAVRGDSGSNP